MPARVLGSPIAVARDTPAHTPRKVQRWWEENREHVLPEHMGGTPELSSVGFPTCTICTRGQVAAMGYARTTATVSQPPKQLLYVPPRRACLPGGQAAICAPAGHAS